MADVVFLNNQTRWWNANADEPVPVDEGIELGERWIALCKKYDTPDADRSPMYIALGTVLARLVRGMERQDPDTAILLVVEWMESYLDAMNRTFD
jgi:hypothetical protein